MSKKLEQKHLSRVLLLSLLISLLGGGGALLYFVQQGTIATHASDASVVGPPSLPGSYVDAIFRRLGSPMAGTGAAIEAASRATNIDDAFALGVWWTETNDGEAGVGRADLNPGSVRGSVGYPSAYDGYTIYPSFTAAVNYWFNMMKQVYIDRGLTTVYTICHPYVGTSTADLWAGKVVALMETYRAEAPPTPTPTPTVPANERRNVQAIATQQAANPQFPVTPTSSVRSTTSSTAQGTAGAASATATTGSAQATGGVSTRTTQALVWLALLLALVLACWALTINKKAAQSARLAGILDTSELSERLRVGMQAPTQPVQPQISWQFQAFAATSGQFRSFASEPPRTEALHMYAAPGLFMTTESLPPLVQSQPLDAHQEQIAQAATGPLPAFRSFAGEFTPFEPQTWGASLCPASPDETPVARQPVGAGSGRPGGLLSRYREGEFSA